MDRVNDIQALAVDGNDNLAIFINDKTCQALSWCFYLASEESTAIVRERPTEFKIFSDQSFW
jgi:hypothetical protein